MTALEHLIIIGRQPFIKKTGGCLGSLIYPPSQSYEDSVDGDEGVCSVEVLDHDCFVFVDVSFGNFVAFF